MPANSSSGDGPDAAAERSGPSRPPAGTEDRIQIEGNHEDIWFLFNRYLPRYPEGDGTPYTCVIGAGKQGWGFDRDPSPEWNANGPGETVVARAKHITDLYPRITVRVPVSLLRELGMTFDSSEGPIAAAVVFKLGKPDRRVFRKAAPDPAPSRGKRPGRRTRWPVERTLTAVDADGRAAYSLALRWHRGADGAWSHCVHAWWPGVPDDRPGQKPQKRPKGWKSLHRKRVDESDFHGLRWLPPAWRAAKKALETGAVTEAFALAEAVSRLRPGGVGGERMPQERVLWVTEAVFTRVDRSGSTSSVALRWPVGTGGTPIWYRHARWPGGPDERPRHTPGARRS